MEILKIFAVRVRFPSINDNVRKMVYTLNVS